MSASGGLTSAHRQQWLRTFERLNLRLLIDTYDDGIGRRMQVQADDVADLFFSSGIFGELECLHSMGLQRRGAKRSSTTLPSFSMGRPRADRDALEAVRPR